MKDVKDLSSRMSRIVSVTAFVLVAFCVDAAFAQEPEPAVESDPVESGEAVLEETPPSGEPTEVEVPKTPETQAPSAASPAPVAEGPSPATIAPTGAPVLAAPEYDTPVRPRKKRKLMVAGLATFGGSYLFTALVAYAMMDLDNDEGTTCENCDDVAPKLFIPVLGPFLATPYADGSDGKTITVLLGLAQTTGIVLTIAGIAKFSKSKRAIEEYDTTYGMAIHTSERLTVALSPDSLRMTW